MLTSCMSLFPTLMIHHTLTVFVHWGVGEGVIYAHLPVESLPIEVDELRNYPCSVYPLLSSLKIPTSSRSIESLLHAEDVIPNIKISPYVHNQCNTFSNVPCEHCNILIDPGIAPINHSPPPTSHIPGLDIESSEDGSSLNFDSTRCPILVHEVHSDDTSPPSIHKSSFLTPNDHSEDLLAL